MFFRFFTPNNTHTSTSGFSLIELMVSISIVVIVTGVVLVRYSSFNNVIILESQAYELALDIREAQVFGVSTGGGGSNFRDAFGIYIDTTTPNQYKLFQDTSGNLKYTSGEEIGTAYTIDPRFTITQVCTTVGTSPEVCTAQYASITFKRPDFDARMSTDIVTNPDVVRVVVAVKNNPSISKSVLVYASGQISVQ